VDNSSVVDGSRAGVRWWPVAVAVSCQDAAAAGALDPLSLLLEPDEEPAEELDELEAESDDELDSPLPEEPFSLLAGAVLLAAAERLSVR
jgi:hypothetical protein